MVLPVREWLRRNAEVARVPRYTFGVAELVHVTGVVIITPSIPVIDERADRQSSITKSGRVTKIRPLLHTIEEEPDSRTAPRHSHVIPLAVRHDWSDCPVPIRYPEMDSIVTPSEKHGLVTSVRSPEINYAIGLRTRLRGRTNEELNREVTGEIESRCVGIVINVTSIV